MSTASAARRALADGDGAKPLETEGRPPALHDSLHRPLRDLRISVTDRCNFRCPYCMPRSHYGPGHRFLPVGEQLTADEIVRLAGIFVSLGVTKIRLTGGEPLLRPDLVQIVRRLHDLAVPDLALTTNGALLRRWANPLARAGLRRLTVSLDSLDPTTFATMSDSRIELAEVLEGISSAQAAGLHPIKLNCMVRRGVNEGSILGLVDLARSRGLIIRFIEYMDVGSSNGWRREDVVTAQEILDVVNREHPLVEEAREPNAVAERYRFADGPGEVGVIASVSRPFCGDCSRARLGSDGHLYTCLFAVSGLDLRGPLRGGAGDDDLRELVSSLWQRRADHHSEVRASLTSSLRRIEMSYVGG
ncbi:MAG: GTP 3',8-cyclase MoaA [Candidatus Dormibacteria bacterium]